MDSLERTCSDCRECPHGHTATQSVFAKGDPKSSLVFVGGAPGENEDRAGLPFVGVTGELLDRMIARMRTEALRLGIALPNPYICNVLKHRPSEDKPLKSGEDIRACAPKLFEQLNALPNARVIVALGRTAAQVLLGTSRAISQLRGHSFHNTRTGDKLMWMDESNEDLENSDSEWRDPERRIIIVPTWHPSYLLHQPNWMKPRHQCWADLQFALYHLSTMLDDLPF